MITVKVVNGGVNIRMGPSLETAICGQLTAGDMIRGSKVTDGFLKLHPSMYETLRGTPSFTPFDIEKHGWIRTGNPEGKVAFLQVVGLKGKVSDSNVLQRVRVELRSEGGQSETLTIIPPVCGPA